MAALQNTRRHPVVAFLASLKLTVACLVYLAALVVIGTIFQSRQGLYAAQREIFQAWFFLAGGFLPLPAVMAAGLVLGVNLLAACLSHLQFRWRQCGLLLIHCGLLLLLAGGFYAGRIAQESFLTLAEGESSACSYSADEWELAVDLAGGIRQAGLHAGSRLPIPGASGAELRIAAYYRNCLPQVENGVVTGLKPASRSANPSGNIPGARLELHRNGGRQQETIYLWAGSRRPRFLAIDGRQMEISLQRRRLLLPFRVRLVDFRAVFYPGSGIASSYESLVEVEVGGTPRRALISMNRPLRLRGLTFFQSSYEEAAEGRQSSTFAVVQNPVRPLPYIATLMTFLGLAVHFIAMMITHPRQATGSGC